jgi:ABC-type branched-subunit amino acid transport system ATPase component
VLRRTVSRNRHAAVRRQRREAGAGGVAGTDPTEPAAPDTASLVAEAALQREVVGCVLELDEPYRSTLLLRYWEDLPPRKVAARGIARSFQIVRLFRNLTVRENVEAGAIARGLGRPSAREIADGLLAEFGLGALAESFAGSLSYGDERRVEIARALAAAPTFLVLDEPAAGMNEVETERLLALLAALPQAQGLGLLIIDHDMPLIMRLCHRLHVLASGRTIAQGDVASVRRSPQVIEAYLGSAAGA